MVSTRLFIMEALSPLCSLWQEKIPKGNRVIECRRPLAAAAKLLLVSPFAL